VATCPECGTSVEDTDRFCVNCGHQLEGTEPTAAGKGSEKATPEAEAEALAEPWVITVPAWLGRDWLAAVRFAGAALVIGVALQYAVLLLLILAHTIAGFDVTWDNQLDRVPIHVFLGFHGPLGEIGLWATGLLWLGIGFHLGGRIGRPESAFDDEAPRWRWVVLALKTAVAYMVPVGVLLALLEPTDYLEWLFPMGFVGDAIGNTDWNIAAGVALGLLVAFVAAAWVTARRRGSSPPEFYGLVRSEPPRWLTAAWAGAKRTILVMLAGVLVFFIVGELIDIYSDVSEFRVWLGLVLAVLVGTVLWAGIDVALIFALMTMRFFLGDDPVVAGGRPGWMWAAVAVVVIAFVLGGMKGAERFGASTPREALVAGLTSGALVAVALFVVSWFAFNPFDGEVITGPVLGLGLLWSVGSGIGGLVQASRSGLFRGIRFVSPGD
jgi:hypothetical protein